jgi:ubiquinone/menaquinone biosynthesis C-methylase UbiE
LWSDVSVARHRLRESGETQVEYVHGLAEDTKIERGAADLVTMCLVAHELPARAMT